MFLFLSFTACKQQKACYDLEDLTTAESIQLLKWNVFGVAADDTLQQEFLNMDHLTKVGTTEEAFCQFPYAASIANKLKQGGSFFQCYTSSEESIIDFSMVCNRGENGDLYKKGSAVYFYLQLISQSEQTVFLATRSSNGIKVWLNGDSIYHSYEFKGFEMTYSEFIPLKVKKGINTLVIKRVNHGTPWLFEGELCTRKSITEEYKKKTTLFLLYNPIAIDSLFLVSNIAKDLDTSLCYTIENLDGEVLQSSVRNPTSVQGFDLSALKPHETYRFQFRTSNHLFVQPFYIGDPDTALAQFVRKANASFGQKYDTSIVGSYIYRLDFLLKHPSRKDDWWWEFKVSSVIAEVSNIFHNLENNSPTYQNSFGIQFRIYRSTIDNTLQRYLLIEPDRVSLTDRLPLVVIIKPFTENYHHFLSSPQLARYWSLTYAKYLADKYRYRIMMPEGRLCLNEPMSPTIESEILQAINDVQASYPTDDKRIYLHGNCTAGFRCLMLACHYPELFAAVGLYAPVYQMKPRTKWETDNVPEKLIKRLRHTPIAVHYDPLDTHSPYKFYKQLIKDCKRQKVPLQVSHSNHSGLHYNVLLVGEEMFDFYKQLENRNR